MKRKLVQCFVKKKVKALFGEFFFWFSKLVIKISLGNFAFQKNEPVFLSMFITALSMDSRS